MISWSKALPVWWSLWWRSVLYGAVLGFFLGFVGGFAVTILGQPEAASTAGMIGGYLGSIPASMLAVKQALEKHLSRLAAIANEVRDARAPVAAPAGTA